MAGKKLTRKIGRALTNYGEDKIFALYLKHGSIRKLLRNMPKSIKQHTVGNNGDMMSMAVWYDWVRETPERAAKWETMKEIQANDWAEQALEIGDAADSDNVQVARLQVDTRKWMAEKFNRAQFGKPEAVTAIGITIGDDFLESLKKVEELAAANAAKEVVVEEQQGEEGD